jgi:hypothetical protein
MRSEGRAGARGCAPAGGQSGARWRAGGGSSAASATESGQGRRSANPLRTTQGPGEHPLGEGRDARGLGGCGRYPERGRGSVAAAGEERDGTDVIRAGRGDSVVVVGVFAVGVSETRALVLVRAEFFVKRRRPSREAEQQHAGREEGGEGGLESAERTHLKGRGSQDTKAVKQGASVNRPCALLGRLAVRLSAWFGPPSA